MTSVPSGNEIPLSSSKQVSNDSYKPLLDKEVAIGSERGKKLIRFIRKNLYSIQLEFPDVNIDIMWMVFNYPDDIEIEVFPNQRYPELEKRIYNIISSCVIVFDEENPQGDDQIYNSSDY